MLRFLFVAILVSFTNCWVYGLQISSCDEPPEYWINLTNELAADKLTLIDAKIAALTKLKGSYSACSKKRDWVLARMLHRLGAFYNEAKDFEQGILLTKEAIEINTHSEDPEKSYLSYSYLNLGNFYQSLGLSNEALNYLELAIQSGIPFPENAWLIKYAYLEKAGIFRETGEFQKCIETAEQGIIFPDDDPDPETQGELIIQKIQAQIELNLLGQAKKELILLKDLAFSDGGQNLEIVKGYYTTNALLLNKLNLHQQAIENLEKSLAINFETNKVSQSIRNFIDIGLIYDKGLEMKEQAIAANDQALQLANKSGETELTSWIYNNLGVVYWRNGAYSEALSNYQKGLQSLGIDSLSDTITENPAVADLHNNLNSQMLVTLLGNKAESLLELSKTEGDLYLDASIKTHKLAVKMIDHMRWNQLTQESKLYWRNISKDVFENALEACTIKQDVESAYYFLEKSRAVMLSDKLSELGARQFIPHEEKEKENNFRTTLHSLRTKLASTAESDPKYSHYKMNWLSVSDSLEHFVKSLEQNYPVYYQYKYDTTFYELSDLTNIGLEKDQSFLSLFVGEKNVYKLCIEQDEPTLKKMEVTGFKEKIDSLMYLVSSQERLNRNYRTYTTVASQLYEAIFGDLTLENNRLIISLDDVLFPFDVLLTDPKNPSSFLLSEYAISYTYSADYLIKNKLNHAHADQSFLGVAPVSYAPHLNQVPLPGAELSLARIKNHFSSSKLLTFAQATKENFLNNINQFGIIQLYSHAEADVQGTEPYLIFTDNILYLSELQFIEKSITQLIILSACNTGVGEFMKGEGIFSLARAFSAAGIPSGINALWKINSKSTFKITELFHQFLSDGMPTDLAIQKAKLEFIANGDGIENLPYFWGANILVGPAITFNANNYLWQWIAFAVLLAVCLIAGARYLWLKVYSSRKDLRH